MFIIKSGKTQKLKTNKQKQLKTSIAIILHCLLGKGHFTVPFIHLKRKQRENKYFIQLSSIPFVNYTTNLFAERSLLLLEKAAGNFAVRFLYRNENIEIFNICTAMSVKPFSIPTAVHW